VGGANFDEVGIGEMGDGVVEGLRIGLGLVVVGDSGVRCMVKVAGVRWMMGVMGEVGMGS
jgi:hypothetical protein